METAKKMEFSASNGHNSNKNGPIAPIIELDLDIMIYLYTKCHFNMCILGEENERKL